MRPSRRPTSVPSALAIAALLAMQQFAVIPRVLCLAIDGDSRIELLAALPTSVPPDAAKAPSPSCATDGCGPCTDVLLELPLLATSRSTDDADGLVAPFEITSTPFPVLVEPAATLVPSRTQGPSGTPATWSADGRIPFLLL